MTKTYRTGVFYFRAITGKLLAIDGVHLFADDKVMCKVRVNVDKPVIEFHDGVELHSITCDECRARAKRLVLRSKFAGERKPKHNADRAGDFLAHYRRICDLLNFKLVQPEAEFKFGPRNQWRADWCFVAERLMVEIDGGQWAQSGGRHSRDSDRIKNNWATENGWRVLHYSTQMMDTDPEGMIEQVLKCLT